MKITSKKLVDHNEILTIEEEYTVRIRLSKGSILSLKVEVQDGCMSWFSGKTTKDVKMLNNLTPSQRMAIEQLLNETDFG